MDSLRLVNNPPARVAILRALQLGDLLCAVPAWRALRAAWPQAEFTLIGLPWSQSLARRFHRYLDRWLEFPGYPGLPEREPDHMRIPDFLKAAQRQHFDLAIQMHGSGSIVNPLTVLLAAHQNAGYFVPGAYCPDPELFMPYPDEGPEIRRHLRLVEFLGIPSQGEDLEFPLTDEDQAALDSIDEARYLGPGGYAIVHAGARANNRRWSPKRFAQVADELSALGLQVVLTGTSEEWPLAVAVQSGMMSPALNLAGRTTLGALALLVCRARLVVCNDTGISHLASVFHTPSVVVTLASDPERWGPLDRERHRVLYRPTVTETGPATFGGDVSAEQVMDELEDLLAKETVHVQ